MAANGGVINEVSLLRPVVIDGSNVAMQLGKKIFATRGILICAKFFIARGHRVITFVPQFRRNQRPDNFRRPMKDQHLLDWMHERDLLVYTPSRLVSLNGDERRRIVCYDDYNIVQYAHETGGVIVSKDQYRDVISDHPEWADTVRDRLLMFSWCDEMFMVAEDPLGRRGPRLPEVLRYAPEEDISTYVVEWTPEQREKLLKEIEEVLSTPPPEIANNDVSRTNGQYESSSSSPDTAELISLSTAPRFGFARRNNDHLFHRSRGWLTRNRDTGTRSDEATSGFGPLIQNDQINQAAAVDDESDVVMQNLTNGGGTTDTDAFMRWFTNDENRDEDEEWNPFVWTPLSNGVVGHNIENQAASTASTSQPSLALAEPILQPQSDNGVDPSLFQFFSDIFPSSVVEDVLSQYKNIRDMEMLSNLLADALIRQPIT